MVNLVASADATRIVRDMPYTVRVQADLRVPLSDGRQLSARAWFPGEGALPAPAVIEYAPFRHRDFTYPRDALIHPWFAGHGYVSIRLEPAGSQDSDGRPMDEYVVREQDDCVEALAWIAAQPWCSGRTGMFGMSWGAFAALQVAARRPPSLQAIIPVHGTDDRYGDDIHYKGGCLLCAGLTWGALYQTYMMRPPDPEVSGEQWRERWLDRLREAPDVLAEWIGHHSRDDYWKHASVCEDYTRIEAATYVICGWADGYTNAAMRMINGLSAPHRVLIGPWGHTYPHLARPGPQFGFLQEATRWWDRWLRDIDNGIDREPPVRLYMQESAAPRPDYDQRAGRWLTEAQWPAPHIETLVLHLGVATLDHGPAAETTCTLCTPLSNAIDSWEWLPHGVGPEMALDQRRPDAGSLCFDTAALTAAMDICGTPLLKLRISSNTPTGMVCARLCDVAPGGASTLVTYGLLDLCHRDGFERPVAMQPGKHYEIEVPLDAVAQSIPAGHRLRLSLSTQAWPLTWPPADAMTLSVMTKGSRLELPVRRPDAPDGDVPEFETASIPAPPEITWVRDVKRERVITRDLVSGRVSRRYLKDDGAYRVEEHGTLVDACGTHSYTATGEDPLSATAELTFRINLSRDDWAVRLETDLTITADREYFHVQGWHRAFEDATEVFADAVDQRIARPLTATPPE